jgi:hypothetical protein
MSLSPAYVSHLFYIWSFLLSVRRYSLAPQPNFPHLAPRHHIKARYVIMSSKDSICRSTGFSSRCRGLITMNFSSFRSPFLQSLHRACSQLWHVSIS